MNKKKKPSKSKKKVQINHHFVFIEVPNEIVSPEVIKWGEASWWPEDCLSYFERKKGSAEGIQPGTIYKQKIRKPLVVGWKVEISEVEPQKYVKRTFLSGMFKGSYELITMESRVNGTRVDYELHYKVRGIINKFLWPLHLEKYHNESIKMILTSLKKHVTQKYSEEKNKGLENL